MGTLKRMVYTIPMPPGANVKGDVVTWTSKGRTKTGTLSGTDRVLVQSNIWAVKFIDENGKTKEIPRNAPTRTPR